MDSYSLTPVAPCEPPAPWIGGKRLLAKRIAAILAGTPHTAYCEPFIGMGGVFFRRSVRPRVEVINDAAGDVVNLFRILKRHPDALLRELAWRPTMRAEFDRLRGVRPQDLTDIERAARFLYLQHLSFGGKVTARSFGTKAHEPHVFNPRRWEARFRFIHERLAEVVIEQMDWEDFLPRYARPETLFYLDPPYWGSEGEYGAGLFARSDFERLSAALASIEAKVLLSINDVPEVRALFMWAEVAEVETSYGIGSGQQAVAELLFAKGVNLTPAAPQARLF